MTSSYCRVSTDSEEQASSYEIQIEHYTNYIKKNKEWELAGIFADDGITGTNTKKREEFNRMIEECMSGKIDMIITKSISRFSRNTTDCLELVRKLLSLNIPLFFEKEKPGRSKTVASVIDVCGICDCILLCAIVWMGICVYRLPYRNVPAWQ